MSEIDNKLNIKMKLIEQYYAEIRHLNSGIWQIPTSYTAIVILFIINIKTENKLIYFTFICLGILGIILSLLIGKWNLLLNFNLKRIENLETELLGQNSNLKFEKIAEELKDWNKNAFLIKLMIKLKFADIGSVTILIIYFFIQSSIMFLFGASHYFSFSLPLINPQ